MLCLSLFNFAKLHRTTQKRGVIARKCNATESTMTLTTGIVKILSASENANFKSKCDSELKVFFPHALALQITQSNDHYISQLVFVPLRCQSL